MVEANSDGRLACHGAHVSIIKPFSGKSSCACFRPTLTTEATYRTLPEAR